MITYGCVSNIGLPNGIHKWAKKTASAQNLAQNCLIDWVIILAHPPAADYQAVHISK